MAESIEPRQMKAAPPAEAKRSTLAISSVLSGPDGGAAGGEGGGNGAGDGGGGGVGGGDVGGGRGGAMIMGAARVLMEEAGMPRAVARAVGAAERVETASLAAAETDEPRLTTVTSASTLLAETAALMAEAATPREEAILAASTVGGATAAAEVASRRCVAVNATLDCSRRRCCCTP